MPRFSYQDQQLIQNAGTPGYWLDLSEEQLYQGPEFVLPTYVSAVSTKTRGWKNPVFCAPNSGSGVDGSAVIPFNQIHSAFISTDLTSNTLYTPGTGALTTPRLGENNTYSDWFNWTYAGVFFQPTDAGISGRNWLFSGSYLMATGSGRTNGKPRDPGAYSGVFQEGASGAYVSYAGGEYTVFLTDSWYNQNFRGSTGRDNNIRFSPFTVGSDDPVAIYLRSRSVVIDDSALSTSTPTTVVHEVELYVNGVFKEKITITYSDAILQNGGVESTSVTATNQDAVNCFANGQAVNPFTFAGYCCYAIGAGRDSSGTAVSGWGAVGEVITWNSTLTAQKISEINGYLHNRWACKIPAQFGYITETIGVVGAPFTTEFEVVDAETLVLQFVYAPSPVFTVTSDGANPDVKNISFQAPTSAGRRLINVTAKDQNGRDAGYVSFTVWFTSDGQLDPIQQKIEAISPTVWLDPNDVGSLLLSGGNIVGIVDKSFGTPWEVVSPFQLQRDASTFLSTGMRFNQAQLGADQPTYLQVSDSLDKSLFYTQIDGLYVSEYVGIPTREKGYAQTILMVTRHDKDGVYNQDAKIHWMSKPLIGSPDEVQYGGVGFQSLASTNNLDAQLRMVAKNATDSGEAGGHNSNLGYDINALFVFETLGYSSSIRVNKTAVPITPYINQQDRLVTRLVFSSASTYSPPYITYDTTEPSLGFQASPTAYAYTQRTSGKFSPTAWRASSGGPPLTATSDKFALGKEEFYWQFWTKAAILFNSNGAELPVVETVAELAGEYEDAEMSILRISYVDLSDNTYTFSLSVGQDSASLLTAVHPSILTKDGVYRFITVYRQIVNGIHHFNLVVDGIPGTALQSDASLNAPRMSLGASYGYHTHGTVQGAYSDLRLALGTLTDYTQVPTAAFPQGSPALQVEPINAVGVLHSNRGYVPGPLGEMVVVLEGSPRSELAELETLLYNKWIQAAPAPVTIGDPSSTSADIGRRYQSQVSISNGTPTQITASVVSELDGNWTIVPSSGNGQGIWTITGSMPLTPQVFSIDISATCDGVTVNRTISLTAVDRTLPVLGLMSPNFAKRSTATTPTVFQGTVPVTLGVYDFVTNLGAGRAELPSANWTTSKDGDGIISVQGQMPQSLSAFEISIDIE